MSEPAGVRGCLLLALLGLLMTASGCDRPEEARSIRRTAQAAARYERDLRVLFDLVAERWAYRDFRAKHSGVDLAALESQALGRIHESPDDESFYLALLEFVAGMRDGHGSIEWRPFEGEPLRRLPIELADCTEGFIVVGFLAEPTSPTSMTLGDVLLSVDGVPIEEELQREERLTAASTDAARRKHALRTLVRSTARSHVTLELRRRASGVLYSVQLPCPPRATWVPYDVPSRIRREVRRIDSRIGYFRPGLFLPTAAAVAGARDEPSREKALNADIAALHTAFDPLQGVEVLILDLRGNSGGTDVLAQELGGILLGSGAKYYGLEPAGRWWWPATNHKVRASRGQRPFPARLICLIDEDTFSAADDLAACLSDLHPNVTFLGRPTGGGTGAPRSFTLPETQARVRFCTMRVYSPSGKLIEGHGTVPDVPVRWSAEAFLFGGDDDMDRALELARATK